jgi:hypothetical protein
MRIIRPAFVAVASFVLCAIAASAFADGSHFEYTPKDGPAGSATFIGSGGAAATASFTVVAPNPKNDGLFPTGYATATAAIKVKGIEKVGDESGEAILDIAENPVSVPVTGALYETIKNAVSFAPSINTFQPNDVLNVTVTVNNPEVGAADYGDYLIKIKAVDQESNPAAGIGEGSGVTFLLKLRATSDVDIVPPTVHITGPSGQNILGPINVAVDAMDPVPGSGLNSLTASIKSAGGISCPLDPLSLSLALPQAAGTSVDGTAVFHPNGWSGPAGTTLALGFTSSNRSGIGSYILTATAIDVVGNIGTASLSFGVNYDVSASAMQIGSLSHPNSTAKIEFTARRSDASFMYDTTVIVKVLNGSNFVMATHAYGTGDIKACVQLPDGSEKYSTHFRRADLRNASNAAPTAAAPYTVKIYFKDIDGNLREQGSVSITF